MSPYSFEPLDEDVFASAAGEVWCVGIPSPDIASRCTIHFDPLNLGVTAAVEAALAHPLPPDGTTFVIGRRPRPDVFGVMAIFKIRQRHGNFVLGSAKLQERLRLVIDEERCLQHWRPSEVPTSENPWPVDGGSRLLAEIAAAVRDETVPLARRVEFMEAWLFGGDAPDRYRDRVAATRLELTRFLTAGALPRRLVADGRIAVVGAANKHALNHARTVGFAVAPVVVGHAPKPHGQDDRRRRRYLIAQIGPTHVRLEDAVRQLSRRESGWRGNEDFASTTGDASKLTVDQVVRVVTGHLSDQH